jgi:hypothetical protein
VGDVVEKIIAPVAITAAGFAAGLVTGGAAFFAIGSTVISAGLSHVLRPDASTGAIAPEPPQPAPANGERNLVNKQATPPRRIPYGRVRSGGAMCFQDNKNPHLLIATMHGDGRIEAVDGVFFGDDQVPLDGSGAAVAGSLYANRLLVEKGLGDSTQAASALLLASFPELGSDFRQRGIARTVARLHWGADAAGHSALWSSGTNPNYLLRGVRVYDPRDGAQSPTDATTWVYSDNPALCFAHAMTNCWDAAIAQASVNWSTVGTAATVCQSLDLHMSGILQAGDGLASQFQAMLASFGGSLTFEDGLYCLYADAPRESVWTITDHDVIAFSEIAHDVDTADLFGKISAEYYDADDAGRRAFTPEYVADVAGRKTALSLLFAGSSRTAQIAAYRALHKSRAPRSFTLTTHDAGLWLSPGKDAVELAFTSLPWLNGKYAVDQVDLTQQGAALKLRSYSATAYADAASYVV